MPSKTELKHRRRCEVCGKRTMEPTYGFGAVLARLGHPGLDKAHRSCVERLQREAAARTATSKHEER